MSIHSRPRNPYRILEFLRRARASRHLWFTPSKIVSVRNFKANWFGADLNYWRRHASEFDWCDEPGCWEDRGHEGPHLTLAEDIFSTDEPVEKL